jgi:hypothetical protein
MCTNVEIIAMNETELRHLIRAQIIDEGILSWIFRNDDEVDLRIALGFLISVCRNALATKGTLIKQNDPLVFEKINKSDAIKSILKTMPNKAKLVQVSARNRAEYPKLFKNLSRHVLSVLFTEMVDNINKKNIKTLDQLKQEKPILVKLTKQLKKFLTPEHIVLTQTIADVVLPASDEGKPNHKYLKQIQARKKKIDAIISAIKTTQKQLVAESFQRQILLEKIDKDDYDAMIRMEKGDAGWKKLYRKLAIKYHTDKVQGSGGDTEDIKGINVWKDAMNGNGSIYDAHALLKKLAGVESTSSSYSNQQSTTQSSGDAYQDLRQAYYDIYGRYPEDPEPQPQSEEERWQEFRQHYYNINGQYPPDNPAQYGFNIPGYQSQQDYSQQDYSQQDTSQQDYDWSSTQYNTPQDEQTRQKIFDMLKKAGITVIKPPAFVYVGFMWLMYHMGVPDFHRLFDEQPQLIKVLYKKLVDLNVAPESPADIPKAMYNVISSLVMKVVKSELTKTLISGLGVALMTIPNGVMSVLQKIFSQMTLVNLSKLDPRKFKKLYEKLLEKIPSGADVKNFSAKTINSFVNFVTPNPKDDKDLSEKEITGEMGKIEINLMKKVKGLEKFEKYIYAELEKGNIDGLSGEEATQSMKDAFDTIDKVIEDAQSRLKELKILLKDKQLQKKKAETKAKSKKVSSKVKDFEKAMR